MIASEVAALLMKHPTAEVLLRRVDGVWLDVKGVEPTGEHRNAVRLVAADVVERNCPLCDKPFKRGERHGVGLCP